MSRIIKNPKNIEFINSINTRTRELDKISRNLKRLNHRAKFYIDGFFFFDFIKSLAEMVYEIIKDEKEDRLKAYDEVAKKRGTEKKALEFMRRYKQEIKVLDSIEINEKVLSHMTFVILTRITENLENFIRDCLEKLNRKSKTKKFYYTRKTLPPVHNLRMGNKYEKKFVEEFLKKTKSNSYIIEIKYEYVIFCGGKPKLNKIANQYKRHKRTLSAKERLIYNDIKKGVVPTNRGPLDTNLFNKYVNLISTEWKKSKVKFAVTRHDWGFDFNTLRLSEKGVDCKIIMEMMKDKQKNKYNFLCLFSNDGDYYPLIKELKEDLTGYKETSLGKNIPIIYPLTIDGKISSVLDKVAKPFVMGISKDGESSSENPLYDPLEYFHSFSLAHYDKKVSEVLNNIEWEIMSSRDEEQMSHDMCPPPPDHEDYI